MIEAAVRVPGRPRDPAADEAILVATLELFAECGYEGLTVEGVAARAGVGKATIYRRYSGKIELVMAAAVRLTDEEIPEPDTGSVASDLRALSRGLVRVLTQTIAGRTLTQLVAERGRNPELARALAQFVAERRAMTVRVVRRGIVRGQLRADTDPELVADLLRGPILSRHVLGEPLDDGIAAHIVDAIIAANAVSGIES